MVAAVQPGTVRAVVNGWPAGPFRVDDHGVLPVTPFAPWCSVPGG
jgi:hypothetical protein